MNNKKNMSSHEFFKEHFWPFDKLISVPPNFDRLSEAQKEPIRMKNRWQLIYLKPFILRWMALTIIMGVLAGLASDISTFAPGIITSLAFIFVFIGFFGSLFITGILFYFYSMRPK